jgi:hypothetical protein
LGNLAWIDSYISGSWIFLGGSTLKSLAVTPGVWSNFGELAADFTKNLPDFFINLF